MTENKNFLIMNIKPFPIKIPVNDETIKNILENFQENIDKYFTDNDYAIIIHEFFLKYHIEGVKKAYLRDLLNYECCELELIFFEGV